MDANLLRGHLDLILLAALEGGAKYGSQLTLVVDAQTQGYFQFREGSLYPALHCLEKRRARPKRSLTPKPLEYLPS